MGRKHRRTNPVTAERLRWLREVNGKSQQVVADFVGVHQTAIGHYERALYMPSTEILQRLADYYAVSLDYLLGRIEERKNLNV